MPDPSIDHIQKRQALVVRCDAEFFLIDIEQVRRIEDDLAISASPFAARGFIGLARFGGQPLSVFSLKVLAEGGPCVRRPRMTVVVAEIVRKDPVQRMGLAVDEVLEIQSLGDAGTDDAPISVVSGFFDLGGRRVRRFNIDNLGAGSTMLDEAKE